MVKPGSWVNALVLQKNIGHMFQAISGAAAFCGKARSGKHYFTGHPRESGVCRWCGVRRTQ